MITLMRRRRRGLQIGLLVVIAAFVASLFVFGSGGLDGGGARGDAVATVNGEAIPVERYQRRYQAYLDAYSRIYRERFSPQLAEQLNLPQQVVNDLVQEAVVVQRARAEGLEVNDEELNAQIQAVPAFHDSGRFSIKRYHEFLQRRGTSAAAFEEDIRRELTRMKMENTVKSGVKVSDAELEQAFVLRREEVRAAWALVETAPLLAAATASADEIAAYLKDHPDEFRQPERRKVQYVTLPPKDFTKPAAEADVEKYYTEHAREFETPRQVRAFHVLVQVPDTGGSEAEDRARAKVADVIARAKAGEDFAALAREVSEDPGSKERGGELGWVSKGEMVPQFEEALFTLGKGGLTTEPVRTPFGFHAIKVTDVKEGARRSLEEVAPQIRERLAAEAAEQAARAKAEEVRPALQAAADFMAEARTLGLTPVETTMARIERPAPGMTDTLEEATFSISVGGVTAPVKSAAGFIVLKVTESIPPGVPPLAEIKDTVAASVKRRKADAAALEKARQVAAEAKNADLAAVAKKLSAGAGETPRFSRVKPAERLPGDAQMAALQTPAGAVTEPVRTVQGYYVLKVLERVTPKIDDLAAERDKLREEVTAQKQSQVWERWVSGARANARVEIHGRVPPIRRG